MSFISDILGSAKDDFVSGVFGAVNRGSLGDITGAVDSLASIAGNAVNNLGPRSGVDFGDGFAGINAREDAVQDWCWYAIMPTLAGKTCPWYYVTSANTPQRKLNVDTVKRNGHEAHFAESYTMTGTLSLKFFVDQSSKAPQYLKAWQSLILGSADPTQAANQGVWGLPGDYKKQITIVVTSVARKQLLTFKYLNCWPSDLMALELGAGSSTPLEQAVEFQVEDVDLSIQNANGVLDNIGDTLTGMAYSQLSGGLTSVVDSVRASVTGGVNGLLSSASSIFKF